MSETTTTVVATRVWDGVELPTTGTFAIDPAHSRVGFLVKHLMVAKVRGQFTDYSGTITIADDPGESVAEASIKMASIDTGHADRDGHLRSPDFFGTDEHPEMTFRSTGVAARKADVLTVTGELTIKGISRPVELEVEVEGVVVDPWGNQRIALTATTEIDREEFGITWNQALETGGVVVGKKVKIEIEAEAVRQA
jgi:polyisoprenoid-binding protein YceI